MSKRKLRLISFGDGGLDLESTLLEQPKVTGKCVTLKKHIISKDGYQRYYGRLPGNDADILLPFDDKYDLECFKHFENKKDFLEFLKENRISRRDVLEARVDNVTTGQGALNAAYGMAVYTQANSEVDIFLVTNGYDNEVKKRLPENLKGNYKPVTKSIPAPININLAINGKITLRSPNIPYDNPSSSKTLEEITKQDGIFIDSVKDKDFLALGLEIAVRKNAHLYVSPTESMINKVGVDSVKIVLNQSEVYIAGWKEIELLLERKIRGYAQLKIAMQDIQQIMKPGSRVYVTNDDKGCYVLDENNELYHHPVARARDPENFEMKNTSGCGDQAAGVICMLELLKSNGKSNYQTREILGYAGAAGQIKSKLPYCSCQDMATKDKINKYLQDSKDISVVRKYDSSIKGFNEEVQLGELKCQN